MLSKEFLKEFGKLNFEQKAAVEAIEGPVMIIAGPGTGKTQILAMRIANILAKTQVNPANILCLTFTNSGVQSMKQRLLEIIGPPSYQIHVHTFHAFCNEIISQFPEKFLIAKDINQLDDLEQVFIIQEIIKNNNFSYIKPLKSPYYYQKAIIRAISELKKENITIEKLSRVLKKEAESFRKEAKNFSLAKKEERKKQLLKNREFMQVFWQYQVKLNELGKYDYDDMILFVLNALRSDSELLSNLQERFHYILLDEYQDTNSAQNKIIDLLAAFFKEPNIFVVGDDEQSIFRFQGASMENILSFKRSYPNAKIIVLKTSYRSSQKILDASRKLIQYNFDQISDRLKIKKRLVSNNNNLSSQIYLGEFSSEEVENYFVAREIKRLINKEGVAPKKIAVLYRNNRDALGLVEYLSRLNVPYQLEGGENILNDFEINKLINLLKILNTPSKIINNNLFLEVMHYPFFKIPALDVYKLAEFSGKNRTDIFRVLSSSLAELDLKNKKPLENFLKLFMDLRKIFYNNTFSSAFEQILNRSGYLNYLLSLKDSARYLNRLQSLFKYIQRLNLKRKNLNLNEFLNHLELMEENNLSIMEDQLTPDFSGVNLMTAHKAKGLEFDDVFIIHLTDKHWGNLGARELIKLPVGLLELNMKADENDEEERRLFYVSLTRAKNNIYLSFAQKYGDLENETFTFASKFIGEIPLNLIKKIDVRIFEKQFKQRLKIKFSEPKWIQSEELKDFISALITDFQLSPTAFNSFLQCPERFFFDNILRVPKVKNFSQSYGTAVHFALERFFKKYQKELSLPTLKYLIDAFEEGIEQEILDKADFERAKGRGRIVLSEYYNSNKDLWKKRGIPISCEFNFSYHNVHYLNVPITGRIDKIELIDSIAKRVRIIDYKTASIKSLNFLLGKTKEKDTQYLFQGYFYKMLADNDPLFNWQIGEIAFEFISDHGFKQVVLPIEKVDYEKFLSLVQKTYDEIKSLNFPKNYFECQKNGRICDYNQICKIAK